MMMEHLPEVTAELQRMEEGNKPLSAELQTAIAQGGGVSFGPANAKVQVVEFSDFQCPYCSRAATVVHQIKEKYGDKVRFTFRQFPLPMHPNARIAVRGVARRQQPGQVLGVPRQALQEPEPARSRGARRAGQAGGSQHEPPFKKSLDDHKFAEAIDSDVKLGEKVQVSGTPSMFVNGARVANPTSFEAVAEMIEAALKGSTPG